MTQLRDDDRRIERGPGTAVILGVAFAALLFHWSGVLIGAALCRHRCDECGKLLEARARP